MKKSQINRTIHEQDQVQNSCIEIYKFVYSLTEKSRVSPSELSEEEDAFLEDLAKLDKEAISAYIYSKLISLGREVFYYDTGHPWLVYWSIHPLILLDHSHFNIKSAKLVRSIIEFLKYCQNPLGGFCGGHHQLPHLASTYAAVLSIVELGTIEAYEIIDRKSMYNFLLSLRNPMKKGSFHMHVDGEEDMRGVYIAVILADLLNLDKKVLLQGVAEHISSCQTYEGGIASEPFGEAHGGYSFCGFAALCCLGETHRINLERFIYWATNRQMAVEGGFNGRTNKVVDNCYSFWQGALFKLINVAAGNKCHYKGKMLYNQLHLQQYCLICCQPKGDAGGLIDKPGKSPDLYHTSYGLAGLSLSQRMIESDEEVHFMKRKENLLKETDPIFNVESSLLRKAKEYFQKLETIH